jgi:hypothetical protein
VKKKKSIVDANEQAVDGTLDRRLLLYAVAAGAALASATPSHAAVVFTPSSVILRGNSTLAIDLDNDGTVDFTIITEQCVSFSGYQKVACIGAYGASGLKQIAMSGGKAAAFLRGDTIGSGNTFRVRAPMGTWYNSDHYGHWMRVANRYLGVKFSINGQTHFGWIGFRSVYGIPDGVTAKLAGWAYETTPDTPIVTDNNGMGAAIQPTSLEILSSGHTGVEQRRKRNRP